MNVLILNWRDPKNPSAGGAEKLNVEIIRPLIERGDSVTWYSKSARGLPAKENYQGIEIIRFGNVLTHLLLFPFFVLTKRFGNVDLVIDCIHGIGYMTPVFMPKTKRKTFIYEVAQNIWDEMFPFPVSKMGKFMESIIFFIYSKSKFWTISKSTKDDLEKMGIKSENIKILPMGFDAPEKIKKTDKYKNPTALFVGRLVKMKGIEDAIEAIYLTNKNNKNKWKLMVVGKGTKNYEQHLRNLISKYSIENYVEFLGFATEAKKFEEMAKAWVLLVPSSREGWGMIIPEANYVRTQVIGYDSPGVRDSLPYFSNENILVQGSLEMSNRINEIVLPLLINNDKIKPGWIKTREFILQNL